MVASFANTFILDGIAYTFGVFLNDYMDYFNESVAMTSLANALLCGVYLLVGRQHFIQLSLIFAQQGAHW